MATVQTDGSSAVTATSTRNNKGVVKHAGTIGANRNFTDSELSLIPRDYRVVGVTEVSGLTEKALSGGVFANQEAGEYVIRHVSDKLAGVANTLLQTPSAEHSNHKHRSVHKVGSIRTDYTPQAIRDGNYNHSTGEFDMGFPVVANSSVWDLTNDEVATEADDDEANTPGEFAYQFGSNVPEQADYNDRYGGTGV